MTLRVVTLPPGVDAVPFARRARRAGADVLEIRDDLAPSTDLAAVENIMAVLWARRSQGAVPEHARRVRFVDEPAGKASAAANLWSHHADTPMAPDAALALWNQAAPPAFVNLKHVEPLGEDVAGAQRLFLTQKKLADRFGPERVTVLATGTLALPFRAALSTRNALDYCALDASFTAAPGQRLLADAVRSGRGTERGRLGILGSTLAGSRSPRIHVQPFDRVDLPADAPISALLPALHPHYRGLAVTSPFKKRVASAVSAEVDSVNTLVRTRSGWRAHNTDVAGAIAVAERMDLSHVVALGDGGVTVALRMVRRLKVVAHPHAELSHAVLRGDLVWTWPPHVVPPPGLRLDGARVVVVAYGAAGRVVASRIRALGGTPQMLGPCWFIAQAREQARLWKDAA